MAQQLLHLVFGGRLVHPDGTEFADLKALDLVGIYPNYAEAARAWRGKAQEHGGRCAYALLRRASASPAGPRQPPTCGRTLLMDGGEALAETLAAWSVDTAFAVPGESYLPVLAALQRRANAIRLVTPRHESGVTFACAAYGRIAGKPAVGLVSRGPGSTNASIGLHVARQDSVPVLLVIGDVPTASKGREAFQEIRLPQDVLGHCQSSA